ncbi:hypothetical protein HS088_TW09G00448 [Tripterygium wilfordii]|uniref:Uncharacterized protein n=1 Tax=Tripterygium wilfordii TaxID=458696 RepID=A0A7J7D7Q4_TRIWF|nr:transcription initiation factor TFIID subunit 11-like [Tripterygium wilfordii]KAF5742400.1 hypothetical protein HS088_TW09G00448 [Tripterygium wilfordii]
MKQSKDPFEAAYEEQEESPPESPIAQEGSEAQTGGVGAAPYGQQDDDTGGARWPNASKSTPMAIASISTKNKEDYDEEEEENMEVELSKFPSSVDPSKMARMQYGKHSFHVFF